MPPPLIGSAPLLPPAKHVAKNGANNVAKHVAKTGAKKLVRELLLFMLRSALIVPLIRSLRNVLRK